jgi:hypothetical protein
MQNFKCFFLDRALVRVETHHHRLDVRLLGEEVLEKRDERGLVKDVKHHLKCFTLSLGGLRKDHCFVTRDDDVLMSIDEVH